MSDYEDARGRVNQYLKGLHWGKGEGRHIAENGMYDLRYEDVALLAQVLEVPDVNLAGEQDRYLAERTAAPFTGIRLDRLEGVWAEIKVLKAHTNQLQHRIEVLEKQRRPSFDHDDECQFAGKTTPVRRGATLTFDGHPIAHCVCPEYPL